ncbi:protein IQ-DOMAIN 14-like [Impatiens glandulifera]|uniref:protein IQ-DOMAIN 14-like n=1 Tax=Impatiens glandulifera TaxID=253017 RepID=UPI001FB13AD6|nr:protein IQ-DOMAIN 14-like [Impatiens glandulifera]
MGKKGNWFSAIKRVFIPNNNSRKDKPTNEKKGRRGKLKHGESKSFIPLFREPSSIEKILEEADEAKLFRQHSSASSEQSTKFPPLFIQRAPHPPRIRSPNSASSRINRPEPTQRYRHLSATKIQAAYRGYEARRSFRALKGLVRLQGVIRGQNVKRQTANAMKMMQLLVRVQTQVQSRRIHMLENQAMQRRQAQKIDRELETTLSKWTTVQNDEWDDSMLPMEEREARLQRKVEAMMKRERAMSYAYSHKLWKATPKSANAGAMDNIGHGGYPWWWNWLERQLPPPKTTPDWSSTKNFKMTPQSQMPTPQQPKPSPSPASFGLDNLEILTPSSTKSVFPTRSKPLFNNTPSSRTPLVNGLGQMRYSKNDDDSLTSCPPFSVPNYMTSTVSTNAKVRACSNPKERFPTPETPINDSKKRFSFPLTPNFSSFKWSSRGSNDKDSNSHKVLDQHQPIHAMGNTSIDSTVSMPAVVGGRKPFNRFV